MAEEKPEEVFHRVVREEGYWGRYKAPDVDDGIRDLLADTHQQMNAAFLDQRLNLLANGRHPDLYFDIIDANENEANAIAFIEHGWAMVGVTKGLFTSLYPLLQTACRDDDFVCSFGNSSKPPSSSNLFVVLYLTAVNFVVNHELGHLVHGHCGLISNVVRASRREISALVPGRPQLNVQAEEVEADGYATHMTLLNLLTGPARAGAADHLNLKAEGDEVDQALLEVFLAAVICFFHLLHQPLGTAAAEEPSHPFELLRINVVIADMQGWCEKHRPSLASWPSKTAFSTLTSQIRSALAGNEGKDYWDEQSGFLDSVAGRDYTRRLYEQREILRLKMSSQQWGLVR